MVADISNNFPSFALNVYPFQLYTINLFRHFALVFSLSSSSITTHAVTSARSNSIRIVCSHAITTTHISITLYD